MSLKPSMAGAVGIPEGVKEAGKRVDFRPSDFALLVETKGYRIAWERAAICPCSPINEQTDQADPTCPLCGGQGWILFAPQGAVISENAIGELTAVQRSIVSDAAVIRAVMSRFENKEQPFDTVTRHVEGTSMVTVRPENVLGYYDRLTNLDVTIIYSQLVTADEGGDIAPKYPVVGVNLLRSASQVYQEEIDYVLDAGEIVWLSGKAPAENTRMVIHYLCHPVWRIIEHPHVTRLTPVKFKTATPVTPQGDPEPLPIQGLARYEWL